jgi:hypothetical protein
MPKKLHIPMEGEQPLFLTGSSGERPLLHTWEQMERFPGLSDAPFTDVEAPSNDLFKRYYHLGSALLYLGRSSQRRGFGHAVKIEPHATQIWGEYKAVTPVVAEGAARNVDKFEVEAKKEFGKATGFITLITAETISKEEAQERARVMWDDFYFKFAGSANYERREEFKKIIRTYHKNYKKKAA